MTSKLFAYLGLGIIVYVMACFVTQTWLGLGGFLGTLFVAGIISFLVEETEKN